MGNELIPVEYATIASICTATEVVIGGQAVIGIADARTLHQGLDVGRDYATWIKARIRRFGFQEGTDFEVSPQSGENPLGGRPESIYRLTLDMAKELAMVENNDAGRLARRYFIWAEGIAVRAVFADISKVGINNLVAAVTAQVEAKLEKRLADVFAGHDPTQYRVKNYKPMLAILIEQGVVVATKRGHLSSQCSARLRRWIIAHEAKAGDMGREVPWPPGQAVRPSEESGRFIFHYAAVQAWLAEYGNALIADHKAKVAGQGLLKLVAFPAHRAKKPTAAPTEGPAA